MLLGENRMNVEKYLKEAYKAQFMSYYYRKPTDEQLKVYMNYFLRKENDPKKVSEVCSIPFNESFSDRSAYIRYFNTIYGFEPSEDQLDMFISFSLCVHNVHASDFLEVLDLKIEEIDAKEKN